jgi:L-2-hydroxyglutarate oxidase LhgO
MSDVFEFDLTIIGAGALGLSTAFALRKSPLKIVVLETQPIIGSITSARNSEVLHAGVYYPTGSHKHKLCLEGQGLMFDYFDQFSIGYHKCGKFIFSANVGLDYELAILFKNGLDNGVELHMANREQISQLSDFCNVSEAIYSPNTGIFDSHAFLSSLAVNIEDKNSIIALDTKLKSLDVSGSGAILICETKSETFRIKSQFIINTAGLDALSIAKSVDDKMHCYEDFFVKGHYFSTTQKVDSEELLYPMPNELGLGIHMTKDLTGAVKFGPDTLEVDSSANYANECDERKFKNLVDANFNCIDTDKLQFSYCGIRPKIKKNGEVMTDFVFREHKDLKMISALSYESPGLTSSLASGEHISNLLENII